MMSLTQDQIRNLDKLIISSFYKLSQQYSGVSASDVIEYLRHRFGDVWNTKRLVAVAEKTLDRSVELGLLNKRSGSVIKCPRCRIPLRNCKTKSTRRRKRQTRARRCSRRRK